MHQPGKTGIVHSCFAARPRIDLDHAPVLAPETQRPGLRAVSELRRLLGGKHGQDQSLHSVSLSFSKPKKLSRPDAFEWPTVRHLSTRVVQMIAAKTSLKFVQ